MTTRLTFIFILCSALLASGFMMNASADIFVRQHKDGHKEFTNRPSGPGWVFYMKEDGYRPVVEMTKRGRPKSLDEIITEISLKFEIDPALVKAIVKAESNCNPNAVSRKGAEGLMQLMPSTARALRVDNTFDPKQNIVGGVKYIKGLIASYGDLRLALAAYNAGPGNVDKYAGIPPYRETINYVKKVLRYYRKYKRSPEYKLAEK